MIKRDYLWLIHLASYTALFGIMVIMVLAWKHREAIEACSTWIGGY